MAIEVPEQPPPGSPPQLPDAPSRSSQGSRPSTAGDQRKEGRDLGTQLLLPWGQTEMQVNIGIDEVSIATHRPISSVKRAVKHSAQESSMLWVFRVAF